MCRNNQSSAAYTAPQTESSSIDKKFPVKHLNFLLWRVSIRAKKTGVASGGSLPFRVETEVMYLGLGLPPTMKREVYSAVNFLAKLVQTTNRNVDPGLVDNFSRVLVTILCERFDTHWFPEKPFKGSGYRCVRITQLGMDPILAKAGEAVGMTTEALYNHLPHELALWIDPAEVSYRIGEEGSICVLYDGSDDDASSNSSSSSNMSDLSSSLPSMSSQYSQGMFDTSAADFDLNFNSPMPAFH